MVIVNNDDHACEKCATHLKQIDKLEIDLKLVKNALLSYIRNKHEILVADEDVEVFIILKKIYPRCYKIHYFYF